MMMKMTMQINNTEDFILKSQREHLMALFVELETKEARTKFLTSDKHPLPDSMKEAVACMVDSKLVKSQEAVVDSLQTFVIDLIKHVMNLDEITATNKAMILTHIIEAMYREIISAEAISEEVKEKVNGYLKGKNQ